jgi:8-demethyl-8-(2-methoxy-alpha-L-rhamnosyl)tetracenomycin-C 3'-O-methyltransferase
MTLDQLAIKHGTDKSSEGHDYCNVYERYFEPLRNEVICLLELGYGGDKDPLLGGESAKMWLEYFPNAEINVLDNEIKENVPEDIEFIHGSQDDADLLLSIFSVGSFDLVIDDASHLSSLTIKSFEILFPLMKSGGYYCIEDTHSSYHSFYYGEKESNVNPELNGTESITTMNYFKRMCDEINKDSLIGHFRLGYDIEEINFSKDLIIIKKK